MQSIAKVFVTITAAVAIGVVGGMGARPADACTYAVELSCLDVCTDGQGLDTECDGKNWDKEGFDFNFGEPVNVCACAGCEDCLHDRFEPIASCWCS